MTSKMATKHIDNKLDEVKDQIEYDDLLSSAGELGRYQWTLFFSTFPFYIFGVFVYFSQMFITEVSPNHWCKIPELENLTAIQRRDLGVPKDASTRFGYSHCEMYAVNWTDMLATGGKPDDSWSTVPCQYGWEFNKSEIPYPTIGSDLEWVCQKNSYQANAQAIFFVGAIFGGFIFGWISDRFGRLAAIISSSIVGSIGGFASTFARNIIEFTAARFVMGMSYDTCMIMAYLILLEYVVPKHRTMLANMSFALFYSFGVTVLPWIALACGHWKTISLVTSVPLALAVFTKFILPENPRWLLSKGRVDEAIAELVAIGRINKKEIPAKMIEEFKSSVVETAGMQEVQHHNCLEIFKRPLIRNMFILICLEYMCCTVAFDGLVRSIGQLDFDFFISFSVISFTEFPSMIISAFLMDPLGRRWLLITCMAISCIFCFLIVFASGVQTIIFAVVARFFINIGFSVSMQWAPEILPTSVRGSGVAIVHICGYAASFLSPYVVYLKEYVYWLPLAVVGAIVGLGMLIAFALPETSGTDMPHTFEDVEELMKNQNLWTLPCIESRKKKNRQVGLDNQSFELEP